MTVAELIEELTKQPKDSQVYLYVNGIEADAEVCCLTDLGVMLISLVQQ